jgi:calcineurin-like phosphoesterase family protein
MTVWFTSDTHFGHANIIRHCARPFRDAVEMDAALAANWNAVVRPGDEVWHLGDFAHRNARSAASYLRRLNGRVHLVWGNHDGEETRGLPLWASSQAYAEVTVEGQRLVLFHYALKVWNRSHRGALHLYGHSHGRLQGDAQCCDLGVDNPAWGYRPVSLPEVMAHLATLPPHLPVDHRGDGA